MSTKKELKKLIADLDPRLLQPTYVFSSLSDKRDSSWLRFNPIAMFREDEGISLVLDQQSAEKYGLAYSSTFRCVSLGVVSSLEMVGLTAYISSLLAKHEISANVIAAYHHDHIFVPSSKAELALEIIVSDSASIK